MKIPSGLFYTRDHEWAEIEGPVATVGITAYAVKQLGDITLVELPEVGLRVVAGDAVGVVESVKAVSDLYSPVTGEVIEINEALEHAPEKVNEDPYGVGWMFRLSLGQPDGREKLLDAAAYAKHLGPLEE